jgi:hypothetical protein
LVSYSVELGKENKQLIYYAPQSVPLKMKNHDVYEVTTIVRNNTPRLSSLATLSPTNSRYLEELHLIQTSEKSSPPHHGIHLLGIFRGSIQFQFSCSKTMRRNLLEQQR